MTPLTSEELTRAFVVTLKGDYGMTDEEKAFVWDVIRRDANAAAERLLTFFRWVGQNPDRTQMPAEEA